MCAPLVMCHLREEVKKNIFFADAHTHTHTYLAFLRRVIENVRMDCEKKIELYFHK